MQSKFFTSPLAAIAAAVAVMTTPVVTSTAVSVASVAAPVATTTAMSVATAVAPAVTSVAVAAVTLMPTDAQAGRRDPQIVTPSAWEQLLAWLDGFFLAED